MKMRIQQSAALAALLAGACAGESGDDERVTRAPSLLALSRDEISVGQSLEFIGDGFLADDEGITEISFEGEYVTAEGSHPVSLRFRPAPGSGTRMVWHYFGPYDIPFSPTGDQLGIFEGGVTAINLESTGREVASEPLQVSLRVGPSIIVRALEPVAAASCPEPATRLLGGFRYRVVTEAVGIDPVDFSLEILQEPGGGAPRVFNQPADGATAAFGDDGDLTFAPSPQREVFYLALLRITASEAGGGRVSSEYAIGVHRPIEFIDHGVVQIAQIEAAVPTDGCLAGGADGRAVTYQEQTPDLRDRTLGMSWNESWLETHGDTFSPAEGNQVSLRFRQTARDGWTADWRDGGAIVGQVGAISAAEWAVRRMFGAGVPEAWPVAHDFGAGDTEAWAYDDNAADVEIGPNGFWQIASADAIPSDAQAEIEPGMFGVWYRQPVRLVRPGTIVTYDLCGEPEVTADASFIDYTWDASMAMGSQCPPFPEPDMREPECFVAPCSE